MRVSLAAGWFCWVVASANAFSTGGKKFSTVWKTDLGDLHREIPKFVYRKFGVTVGEGNGYCPGL